MGYTIIHNKIDHRFEVREAGETAYIEYEPLEEGIDLTHTYVPRALEQRGIGSLLVRSALDYARNEHLRVVLTCPFTETYVKRHPEYRDMVCRERKNSL